MESIAKVFLRFNQSIIESIEFIESSAIKNLFSAGLVRAVLQCMVTARNRNDPLSQKSR